MEFHRNKATRQRPEGDRVLDATYVLVDTPFVSGTLSHEQEARREEKAAYTVFKSDMLAVVLLKLDAGNDMYPGKTAGTLVLQVLRGSLDVQLDGESIAVEGSQLLIIKPYVECRLQAKKDADFYLFNAILHPGKKRKRARNDGRFSQNSQTESADR